jgi:DNA-binding GntR family transcriptional regulator
MNEPKPSMVIARDSTRQQIKQVLLDRIVEGEYEPGRRLVELQIAREFRTSQAPVREALRELEALRLVACEPYRGTYVRAITEQELRETYQVRATLEELGGRLAAPRLKGNVGDLEVLIAQISKCAKVNDLKGYVQHDIDFHRKIIEASGNAVLLRAWDGLILETRVRMALSHQNDNLNKFASEHGPIVDALRAGDTERSATLMRNHIHGVLSLLENRFADQTLD